MASKYANALAKLDEINKKKNIGYASPKISDMQAKQEAEEKESEEKARQERIASSRYSSALAALDEKRHAEERPALDLAKAVKAPTAKSALEITLDRAKRRKEQEENAPETVQKTTVTPARLGETRRETHSGLYTAVPAKHESYADASQLGGTLKEAPTKITPEVSGENAGGSNFFDNLLTRAKYIGESGKIGFESGVDALKNTGKTFASSISEFLETLFPGKEVGDSGVKLPTFRTNRHATLTTYADSMKNGLEQGGKSAVDAAATAHNDELIRNLNQYADTNTRQKKMEELQTKYSDEDIGVVTQVLADGANSIGYNLPSQAVNLITGGLGGAVVMGTQAFGDAYSDAKNSGASNKDALEYAAKEAINQGSLDTLFGAFGDSVIGSRISKIGAKISKPVARSLFEVGTNAVGEGAEEVLQSLVSTANQKATYDPEATVDPSALAYEGLLGGLMGGFYGALSLPGKIKTNKVDYDLVNQYSRRAAQTASDSDAETMIRVGNAIVDSADEVINNRDSSAEDIARATYIKNGIAKTMSILEGYKDRIIVDNNERSVIVSDIVNKPVGQMNTNIARLVDKVAESIEPGDDAVNRTVDYLRGEIMAKDYAIYLATTPEGKRINELERRALIEIDKTLRQNRTEIEAIREANAPADETTAETEQNPDNIRTESGQLGQDLGNVEEPSVNPPADAVENTTEPLTETPAADTMEETTEVPAEEPVVSRDFSLAHKQTKHTKTGETLDVFSASGKLSKDEYAALKSKMKEIGGFYSKFVKGFIVPTDKVDAVSEFADVTAENTNQTVGESEKTVGETAPAVGETTPEVPIVPEAQAATAEESAATAETEVTVGETSDVNEAHDIPLESVTEEAKERLKRAVRVPVKTTNAMALKIGIQNREITFDDVTISGRADGFSREQQEYLAKSLLEGAVSENKGDVIHVDVPYDGTFDIKNTPDTVAIILDRLKVRVEQEVSIDKNLDSLLRSANRIDVVPYRDGFAVVAGAYAKLISASEKDYILSEYKAKESSLPLLTTLLDSKPVSLTGEIHDVVISKGKKYKAIKVFGSDDRFEIIDPKYIKLFPKGRFGLLTPTPGLHVSDADGNPIGIIMGVDPKNLVVASELPSKMKLKSISDTDTESGSPESTSRTVDGTKPEVEKDAGVPDDTERSDKHQAIAEGVIPTVSPQATTSVPEVGEGMQTETVAADSLVNSFYSEIADRIVADYLETGAVLSIGDLQKIATTIYKGTLAEGAFSVKDMTDALELAVNRHIIKQMSDNTAQYNADTAESAVKGIEWAEGILAQIPTQTKRTDEQIGLQQFSTPPNIAYLANWIANISDTDFMLEPSAGIGGLASFAKGFGAATAVNEISERRLGALRSLGFDHVFSEDAAQLDNILPDYIKPTVVVMNPPFSSTGGRTKNSTANAKPHVEQALNRLENGGRLVAILGQGMSNDAPMFAAWWDEIRKNYNIRANIGIDGSNYRKYGTTFNVRLVVIDKTGPQNGETITGDYKSLNDIPKLMEGVRNDRTHTGTTESNSVVEGHEGAADGTLRISEPGRTASGTVSSGDAADVAGGNDVERGLSSDGGRGVRRESDPSERIGADTGTAVQSNNEQQPGGRRKSSGTDENVADVSQSESRSGTGGSTVGGRGTSDNDLPVDGGQSGNADVDGMGGRDGGITETPKPTPKTPKAQKKKANTSDDGIYAGYTPSKLAVKGAKPHPATLVESSAMAAVAAPEITYAPKISQDVIDKGLISDVQLENISYAGQAHEQMLENGTRKGYFVGDGTGVGKGRQAAGIILDNFNQGRRKALWISEKAPLMEDAKRDWGDIGGNPDDIFDIDGIRKGVGKGKNKKIPEEGILFVPYSTVKSGKSADKKTTNADTIIQWLGKDFDGVIVYDEAHNMNSLIPSSGARGMKKAAQQAVEANKIQEALPNARVVYMSATGATEVKDLCFASRLGLWGKGTQFMNAEDFSSKIGASGVAGMELVASSLKSMGVYQARSISFEGVRYDSVKHKLTKQQRQIYDTMSEAWQITLQNMEQAIKITGVKNAGTARSIFYSTMQNFYNQVLSSMATPSVIEDIKKELAAGHSCVIQLINTNETQQEKELSKAKAEERDLEELDITPRGALLGFLENSFPVQQYEKYLDEHGNENSRPVFDSKGNPVLNKQAVAARDALIARINEMSIPDGPIDMILNAFGADNVAEVTGRSRRVVNKPDENGNMRKVEENLKSDFRIAETTAFQNGEKRILIFSNAGSTGRSYHADKRAKNQQQRIHYILQPGWNAKTATQGFGRTHRSNQVQPPVYKLVQTDIEGQKRFVTSIARRLDQLGALTKGQRQTGSGIFGEKDNLESKTSIDALREFYSRLGKEKIPGVNGRDVFTKLGLYRNFYDEYGNFTLKSDKAFDITTFLNRLLALKVDEQNIVFGEFESIRQQMYDAAIENGTLDMGISNVKADKITVNQEETIYTDEKTGAETKYIKATAYTKATVIPTVDDAIAMRGQFQGLRRMKDGSVRAVYRVKDETDPLGRVHKKYLLQSPNREIKSSCRESTLLADSQEIPKSEWDKEWTEELKNVPEYNERTLHFITGAILTVWNKLPQDGSIKAIKIVTDDGSQLLGRIIPATQIDAVLRGMDIKQKKEPLTGHQLYDAIMKSGKEATFAPSYSGRNTIKRSRVAGENRLEITGTNLWSLQSDYPDIISETIQYQRRYFIPTGEKGVKILEDIVSKNNVTVAAKDENSVFYSNTEGKWGKGDGNGKKLKSVSDLQREATRIFGVQINTGKVGGGAAGVYKTHAHTIRTRVYGDLPTIAHELGHWFDQRYNITDSDAVNELVDLYRDDLEAVGYHESIFPHEAVAYYFADLLRNKTEAETKAPGFSAWLDSTLSRADRKRLAEYTDMVNEYHAADMIRRRNEQVHFRHKDHSTLGEAQLQIDTLLNNPASYLGSLGKKFVRSWLDDIVDLKPFDKTYALAMKERAANSIASGRLNIAFTDNQGNVIGKSLAAVLHEGGINDINHKDFNAYLIARVALDRIEAAEAGENVATLVYADAELQDKDSIIDAIQTYERDNPTFADAANGVYEYRNNLLDVAVESGIISESLANYFKETFPHYVPLYRVMDDKSSVSSGRGKKTPKAPIGRFKGSGRDIYAPIENLAIQTSVFTKAILQNETRRAFADYIDSHEDMGWAAEQVPEARIFDVVSTDEIGYRLSQFDSDKFADMTAEQKAELFEEVMGFIGNTTGMWKAKTKQDENVISVLRNGQRVYYEVHDQDLMDAMLTMTPKEYGVILSTLGKLTAGFKVLTTGSNPRFGMTNVPRDVQSGYISSKTANNPVKYVIDFVGAFAESIAETEGYKEYLRNGGGYSGALTMDMRNLKHEYRDLVQSSSALKRFLRSAVGMIPRLIDAGESASRYAEFKRARKQGIEALEALRKSQEITVNFQRHGKISTEIDKVIPYFNASLQSLYHYYDVLFKGKTKEKAGAWAKFIGSNVTMSAMLLVWNYVLAPQLFDDEEKTEESFENLSTYNKNAYWCFYIGNGEFFRLAKPKDMMVPSTVITNMFEMQVRDNPAAFYNYGDYLAQVFFPPAASDATIVGTALSLAKNETFTGAPIVSTAYQNLAPELQYNEKTSKLGIALGSVLGLSPMQIDYVIDDTTGFVGDFLLNLTQQEGVKAQNVLDLDDNGVPNVLTADSVYSTDVVSIFYDTKAKYDTGKASYKATGGENDKYTAYDAYGSYKYGKIADLYSAANKLIKADGNEESARKTRAALNALVKSINETAVTDIDTAVSKIAEESGYEIGDIAPYIVVPDAVKDSKKNEYALDAYDMMEYYAESQMLFEAVYPKLIDSGYDAETIAEAMKQVKKELKKQMDARYVEIVQNK